MKAMIFAAGLGTRLRPLTDRIPKALVPVAGVPLLQRVLLKLKDVGITDITVNIHHRGQQIIDFLQTHRNFGLDIHISDERTALLDTGGGILHARRFLDGDEPFLVHNADILTDADLDALIDTHRRNGDEATLLVSPRTTSRYLLFDDSIRLHGWTHKKTGEVRPAGLTGTYRELAFAGIHLLSPSIFRLMDEPLWQGRPFSIIDFYLHICPRAKVSGCLFSGTHWFDTGTPDTLGRAEAWYSAR